MHLKNDKMKKNIINKSYGCLTVAKKLENNLYECECICKNIFILPYSKFKNRNSKCTCNNVKDTPEIGTAKAVFRANYQDGNIKFEDFYKLSKQNCFYCKSPPKNKANIYLVKTRKYSEYAKTNGFFIYNGLDRITSKLDYSIENVIPCCFYCNSFKNTLKLSDWVNKINSMNFKIKLHHEIEHKINSIENLKKKYNKISGKYSLKFIVQKKNHVRSNAKKEIFLLI